MSRKGLLYDHFNNQTPTWCPGCGNFAIWTALKKALTKLGKKPHEVLIVYGIGCSGNMSNTVNAYGWHGLHGRAVPPAIGAKLANKDLTVIIIGGDGDGYGEGLSHFIHGLRGNVDVTYFVHNNSVYGLTTGQASPTSAKGFRAKSTPDGLIDQPLNPLALALSAGASFVARGFAGHEDHLVDIMVKAIQHKGFSFVDMFQPCVTFSKLNTYAYYYDHVYSIDDDAGYDKTDRASALVTALAADRMVIGVLYQNTEMKSYEEELFYLKGRSLVKLLPSNRSITKLCREFI